MPGYRDYSSSSESRNEEPRGTCPCQRRRACFVLIFFQFVFVSMCVYEIQRLRHFSLFVKIRDMKIAQSDSARNSERCSFFFASLILLAAATRDSRGTRRAAPAGRTSRARLPSLQPLGSDKRCTRRPIFARCSQKWFM